MPEPMMPMPPISQMQGERMPPMPQLSTPPQMGAVPGMEQQIAPPEEQAEAQQILQELQAKKASIENGAATAENDVRKIKIEILTKFFDALRDLGVDPNNQDELKAFFDKLSETNPDLVTLLEKFIDSLDPSGSKLPPLPARQAPSADGQQPPGAPEAESPMDFVPPGFDPSLEEMSPAE